MPRDFDATITLNDHHLDTAGLSDRKYKAVAAVREAVARWRVLAGFTWRPRATRLARRVGSSCIRGAVRHARHAGVGGNFGT
jgi:hypothetical protein